MKTILMVIMRIFAIFTGVKLVSAIILMANISGPVPMMHNARPGLIMHLMIIVIWLIFTILFWIKAKDISEFMLKDVPNHEIPNINIGYQQAFRIAITVIGLYFLISGINHFVLSINLNLFSEISFASPSQTTATLSFMFERLAKVIIGIIILASSKQITNWLGKE